MSQLANLSVNTIRTLSIDAIQKANSGHPGLPLGAAPMGYVLWQHHLRHDPGRPDWPDRDRFVLSAGHGSMLLYSLLHLTGYDLSLDELARFRQWGSKTPGHPEYGLTPGVEATTGPLGQGAANAVGMALAERALAARFNRPGHTIVDHHTYALVSDGDLMEGVSAEAASLAGHLGLGKLIYLYDANDVTLDGPTALSFSGEDVCARYASYGWQVLRVENGNEDLDGIDAAIRAARDDSERPTLIWVHTTIGYGSPNKAGSSSVHGSPLGAEELALTKQELGWSLEGDMRVPDDVRDHMGARGRGSEQSQEWQRRFDAYASEFPELAAEWKHRFEGTLPDGWSSGLPAFEPGSKVATRSAGGKVQNAIAARIPWLLGGDADLGCSTKTLISEADSFDGRTGNGRNIHFGVREHAMGAICNGMDYHGGIRPYAATFFCFSDYMRPAVRIASLNHRPLIYLWTHDSIGLGEDGPTHQPVEHLMSLRVMPNLWVMRPADATETAECWQLAMERTDGPIGIVMSRQDLPVLEREAGSVRRGAYVVAGEGAPEVILIGTGSELHVAIEARIELEKQGIRTRVVSMPCWELFQAQDATYRDEVLPPNVTARVSVEAGATLGWERWIGTSGVAVGLDRFGASAPGDTLLEKLGINVQSVVAAAKRARG